MYKFCEIFYYRYKLHYLFIRLEFFSLVLRLLIQILCCCCYGPPCSWSDCCCCCYQHCQVRMLLLCWCCWCSDCCWNYLLTSSDWQYFLPIRKNKFCIFIQKRVSFKDAKVQNVIMLESKQKQYVWFCWILCWYSPLSKDLEIQGNEQMNECF